MRCDMMRNLRPRVCWLLIGLTGLALAGCPAATGPKLAINPAALNFGANGVDESFTIGNDGTGALNWTLSHSVPWITSVDVTSGTVTNKLQRVHLTVDRTGLAPGADYSGVITIDSNGGTKTVRVALSVPGTPGLDVSPKTVSLLGTTTTGTFTVTNTGNGPLNWSLKLQDPSDSTATIALPSYMTISPLGGVTAPGASTTVTITIDRTNLTAGITSFTLQLLSNAGDTTVGINIGVGTSPVIGVDPNVLEFGEDLNELTFNVFNNGPSGTVLNFTLTTDRPDLIFLAPTTGQSVGTATTDKNGVPISVTIDRNALKGSEDGGTITVSADGIDSVSVAVTAKSAPLRFEGAINRSRPPFIQRFVFLMRDGTGKSIDSTNPAIFQQLQTAFKVSEDGVVLDPAESNTFVTGPQNLKYNIILLLDFTGSMYNAETGSGVAIDQMVAGAKSFISDLPGSYRIAVMEYHERQQTNRLIHGFSTAKQPLLDALDAFSLPVGDHGASEVLDAVTDACTRLVNEDAGALPFDDADVRAVVFVTDGRDTSSIKTAEELSTLAKDSRVRLYPIGFGDNVNSAPLVKLAADSGGHYYVAATSAALTSLLDNADVSTPAAPGLVTSDLERQVVLTYITLFQEGSHNYLIEATYQGLQGSFKRDSVFAIGGDVRAGQIALRTAGIQGDNTAEVYVRAEYVPRNVTQFKFRFITPNAYTVELLPEGLLAGWTLVPGAGGVYTMLTTDANYLPYGSFGDLLKVTFTGLGGAFDLGFRVDNQIYINPPTTKFFQYPDSLSVGTGSSAATVAPLLLSSGFDPDALDAFDRDGDGVTDFNDAAPTNPLVSKSLGSTPNAAAPNKLKE